jgi:O-methyltransferase
MQSNYFGSTFFGVARRKEFATAIMELFASLRPDWKHGLFAGDNLITFGKNLSFQLDNQFMQAVNTHASNGVEKSIVWRTSILVWAARNGLRREGDFVECGCYRGTSARIICDAVDFNKTGRHYYLYDKFELHAGNADVIMPDMALQTYDEVVERFSSIERAHVIKGIVPDILTEVAPDKIAFLHLDLNNVTGEIAALEALFDRVVSGGMIVLDDYGYFPYRAQQRAERQWFSDRGYDVVELPTGQGLVIK